MLGKISRLPRVIRDQLNQRLANAEPADGVLLWLNGLPETQALLRDAFDSQPISEQNLSDYRKRGFRQWQMRQTALEFLVDDPPSSPDLPHLSSADLVEKLVRWISLRFAAAAQDSALTDDPDTELREVRALIADIVSLRRGELVSRRIQLEQQRLDLEQQRSEQNLEQQFWEWTRRPDIQARLCPDRDPDKLRTDVVRLLDHQLLGSQTASPAKTNATQAPDPACLI